MTINNTYQAASLYAKYQTVSVKKLAFELNLITLQNLLQLYGKLKNIQSKSSYTLS